MIISTFWGRNIVLYKAEQNKLRISQIKETAQLLEVDEKEAEEIWKTRNP